MENTVLLILKYLIFPGILFIFASGLFVSWFDRKVFARMQNRVGPPFFQPLWDIIKLLAKEDITPAGVDRIELKVFPTLQLMVAFILAMFLPIYIGIGLISFEGDLFFVLFLLAVFGGTAMFIGWSDDNPYTLIGAGRAAIAELSFEIPLGLALFTPAILVGSAKIKDISTTGLFGIFGFAFDKNPIFLLPLLLMFVVAILAGIAVCEKVPFDAPEAEVEIVGGWTAELSGKKYAFVRLASHILEFSVFGLIATLFFGGPYLPADWISYLDLSISLFGREWFFLIYLISTIAFFIKMLIILLFSICIRIVSARLRIDQLATYFWEWLLPISIFGVILTVLVATL